VSQRVHASRRFRAPMVIAVAALVAALALAACASTRHTGGTPSAGAGAPAGTSTSVSAGATVPIMLVFAPSDRSGGATAGAVAHRSGSCFTTSITVSATDAYRCFAGNSLLDPCFASPSSPSLLDCYASPWARAVQLRITGALPKGGTSLSISRPWAIELAGGLRCVATNGTPQLVRGVALTYQCADGAAGLRTPAAPQALYAASDGAVRTVGVVGEWRTARS
jgi:hypothetical protein